MQYQDLLDEAEAMGVTVAERPLAPGACGYYYEPSRLIIIDETMPEYMQCCTLAHELVHAKYHDQGHGDAKAERRARRETCLRMIDLSDYVAAESVYGGDPFLLAQALNRTVQVVQDYQTWLHDCVGL